MGRVRDGGVAKAVGRDTARQFVDVCPCRDGEAHVVDAATAFVEGLARIVRMLDQPHAQPAWVHEVDPGKLGSFIEPVAPDLEAEQVGMRLGARVTVRDRQIEAREPR